MLNCLPNPHYYLALPEMIEFLVIPHLFLMGLPELKKPFYHVAQLS